MSVDLAEARRVANAIDGIMPAECEGAAYDRVSIREARKTILALAAEVERLKQLVNDKEHLLVCYRTGKRPSEKVLDRLAGGTQ